MLHGWDWIAICFCSLYIGSGKKCYSRFRRLGLLLFLQMELFCEKSFHTIRLRSFHIKTCNLKGTSLWLGRELLASFSICSGIVNRTIFWIFLDTDISIVVPHGIRTPGNGNSRTHHPNRLF